MIFIYKKLDVYNTIADQKSDLNAITQIDGSQIAYGGELRLDNLNFFLDSIQIVSDGFNNIYCPLGEKIALDPLTRVDEIQFNMKYKDKISLKEIVK